MARAIIRKLHEALWSKKLDTPVIDESKFTFFSEFAGLVLQRFNDTEINFSM